jgi:hypothetical protein
MTDQEGTTFGEFLQSGDYKNQMDSRLGLDRDFDPNTGKSNPKAQPKQEQPAPVAQEQPKSPVQEQKVEEQEGTKTLSDQEYKEYLAFKEKNTSKDATEQKNDAQKTEGDGSLSDTLKKILSTQDNKEPEQQDATPPPEAKTNSSINSVQDFNKDDLAFAKEQGMTEQELSLYSSALKEINSAGKFKLAKALIQAKYGDQNQQQQDNGVPSVVSVQQKNETQQQKQQSGRTRYSDLAFFNN